MTTTMIPAALTTVARNALGDATNGGISATANRLAVVGIIRGRDNRFVPMQPGHCDGIGHLPTDGAPASVPCVALWVGLISRLPSAHLVPVGYDEALDAFTPAPGHHMNGGNWAIGSPLLARVANCVAGEPILGYDHAALPIHDRTE